LQQEAGAQLRTRIVEGFRQARQVCTEIENDTELLQEMFIDGVQCFEEEAARLDSSEADDNSIPTT
jgi:hypothetical protein